MDTSGEERIKLKLDSEEENERRFGYSGDKENQSAESNKDKTLSNEPSYLSQYLEVNLGQGKQVSNDREVKHSMKNAQSRRSYMNNVKNKPQEENNWNRILSNYDYYNAKEIEQTAEIKHNKIEKYKDSLGNTTKNESNQKIAFLNIEPIESKESSDDSDFIWQKCNFAFDNKHHLPLCLPSGQFFWKQWIIKMQMRKQTKNDNFWDVKIPKDISKLPVLSMLINYEQK